MLQAGGPPIFSTALLVFGVGVGGLGGWLVYSAVGEYRTSGRREEFEPVEARVVHSELEGGRSIGDQTGVSWMPDIEYEYTVEGERYRSDSVWPGRDMTGTDKQKRQAVVDSYPEGEVVEAYYDPENPSVAFLEDEAQVVKSVVLGIFGVVFLLWGLGMVGFGAVLLW